MKQLLLLSLLLSLVACQPKDTNTAPVVNAGEDLIEMDVDNNGIESVQLNGSAIDSENNIIGYQVIHNDKVVFNGIDASVFKKSLELPVGSHKVTLIATDLQGLSGIDSLIIEVKAPEVNTAPVVNAGADVSRIDADKNGSEMISLAGSATDAQNNITSYRVLRNGTQILSGSASSIFTQSISVPVGSHTIVMEATDAKGLKASDTMMITVTAPVVASSWTYCAAENQTCNLPGLATVRYGANSSWVSKDNISGNISCSNAVFGDPLQGVFKSCEYQLTPEPSPALSGVVAEGDSISIFWGGNYTGIFAKNHPTVLPFSGLAVGGSGMNAVMNRQANALSKNSKVLSLLIGANDLASHATATEYAEKIFNYASAFRTKGTKVAVGTILPISNLNNPSYATKHNSLRAQVNSILRAAVGTRIDAVIDFAADPEMGDDIDATNKTYYSDGVHPTDPTHGTLNGQSRLAAVYTPVMEKLLGLEVSPAPVTNTAPVVNGGPSLSAVAGTNNLGIVTLQGSATDKENNIFSYAVKNGSTVLKSGTSASILSSTLSLAPGSYTLTLEAVDAGNLRGSATVSVTISAPPATGGGNSPVANAGADIRMVMPVQWQDIKDSSGTIISKGNNARHVLTLSGTASDPDNDIVHYAWKLNGVAIAKGSSPSILTNTQYSFIHGNHVITLEVTDSKGNKAVSSKTLELIPHIDNAKDVYGRGAIPGVLTTAAGGHRFLIDHDSDGFVTFRLTGAVNSVNPIVSYKWIHRGVAIASGSTPDVLTSTVTMPLGNHNITFEVTDSLGNKAQMGHTVQISMPVIEQVAKIPTAPELLTKHLVDTSGIPGYGTWYDQSAFRFKCKPSHLSFDDPIVFPGQPGKAHLHQFFGNTMANGNSTYESLRKTGDGTCDGGPLNRSAYWMPALLDSSVNKAVLPDFIIVYYKRHPGTNRIPRGLKMIFGYDHRLAWDHPNNNKKRWSCEAGGDAARTLPELVCPAGKRIIVGLSSPDCWDGKNLDSADHRAHVAYSSYSNGWGEAVCPATHPVSIPQFSMKVFYTQNGIEEYKNWRFSSDHSSPHDLASTPLDPGSTMHSDWFGAWDDSVMDLWHDGCMDKHLSCNDGNLGTGQRIASDTPWTWSTIPRLVDPPAKPLP